MSDTNRFDGAVNNLAGRAQEAVGAVTGDDGMRAEGVARQAVGAAQDAYGRAWEQAREYSDSLRETVQRQPLVSLLVAGAIGWTLSMLCSRH